MTALATATAIDERDPVDAGADADASASAGASAGAPGGNLDVEVHSTGSLCVLRLKGSYGAGDARRMAGEIDRMSCSDCRSVLVDISLLEHIDEVGVNQLSGMREYLNARGRSMSVYAATGPVADALHHASLLS